MEHQSSSPLAFKLHDGDKKVFNYSIEETINMVTDCKYNKLSCNRRGEDVNAE